MRKIFGLFLIVFCSLSVAACKTTVQDGSKRVTIEDGSHGNGEFCPPGQAKKGNC